MSAPREEMSREEFVRACLLRLGTLYRTDNAAYGDGTKEPMHRHRDAPDELEREVRRAVRHYEDQWDSEYK